MKKNSVALALVLCLFLAFSGCSDDDDGTTTIGGNGNQNFAPIVVTSLGDAPLGRKAAMTFRAALDQAASSQPIVFDQALDGKTIELSIIGEEHTPLIGEVMDMVVEPSGQVTVLEGYSERDYGRSALYAKKNVVIDASSLPNGITLKWMGVEPARVLAVYGNLTMTNVAVTGGSSVAVDISTTNEKQPWTLARGAGLAVWGAATLKNCSIYGNSCEGDTDSSRDRGAFGGGVFADIVLMDGCTVSGNSIFGGGAAGGGVFSVGGQDANYSESVIQNSSITGNHISALFTYGAGIYSDGGGIGNTKDLVLINCTIAQNLVDASGMPGFLLGMGYWRGGGVYMSNGNLDIRNCTIVENQVHGMPRTDALGKPNLAGGVAATIGNAHAVEDMRIYQSIITGNTVHPLGGDAYAHDIFTGSLLYFKSRGYNRFGVVDFSQILVPVGEKNWASLVRKHFPKQGDQSGVDINEVLDLAGGVATSDIIDSAGVDAGNPVALHYQPFNDAVDQIPAGYYYVSDVKGEYWVTGGDQEDNFLEILLARLEVKYELDGFAAQFTSDFDDFLQAVDTDTETDGLQPYTDPQGNPITSTAQTLWFGPADTWPKELPNYPYIEFWHQLDQALAAENIPGMGPEILGDDAWKTLFSAPISDSENPNLTVSIWGEDGVGIPVILPDTDQLGTARPVDELGDVGAIEAL